MTRINIDPNNEIKDMLTIKNKEKTITEDEAKLLKQLRRNAYCRTFRESERGKEYYRNIHLKKMRETGKMSTPAVLIHYDITLQEVKDSVDYYYNLKL